ncbi:hypothetical protein C2G38_2151896 [Gigaspora rosea]|uniref:Uncharacterized protein n=1 Tax=Gigaspora rosea TaxID=44941 RepID=A0A397W991_9GLOM|nr:hypothetical protein C2G38_2151896 [Gigaspora rosea]
MKDPFRPIENIQVSTTIGSYKNHGAKPRKQIYINEDVDQEYNIFEHSVLSEISTSQNEDAVECTDSYSIRRRNTTRIRNKHRSFSQVSSNEQENNNGSAIKDSLEELFLEKGCD